MKTEYITIKEFAEIAGVSQQSVYKRLNKKDNPLKPYFKEVEGKKLLRRSALSAVYGIEPAADHAAAQDQKAEPAADRREDHAADHSAASKEKSSTERLFDLLEQQLQEKDRQLQEKDKQIEEKDKQLNSLLQRLEEANRLIDQQQQLAAFDKKDVQQIESQIAATTPAEPVADVTEKQETPKKRSFWDMFRGK